MNACQIEMEMDKIKGFKKETKTYKNCQWSIVWESKNCKIEINSYGNYLHVAQNDPSVWSCTPFDNVAGFKKDSGYLYVLDAVDYTYKLNINGSPFF